MHFLLLDANNLLCRAFFVGEKIYTESNKPIGGICAFAAYIQSLIRMLGPTHIAMARDLGSNTWRHKLYPEYKKNRTKADQELYLQFPMVPVLSDYLGIPLLDHPDFEADDCLATLAHQAQEHANVTIVSTDKDLCQMINSKIRIYSPHTKKIVDAKEVQAKYSLDVDRLTDYFALTGDQSDNLPGVSGVGPKNAHLILKECNQLDQIPEKLDRFPASLQKKLLNQEERIRLMKNLVTLTRDVELTHPFAPNNFDHFKMQKYKDAGIASLKKLLY